MSERIPPKAMAKKLVRALRPQHPDALYLKKVFQYTRELLDVTPTQTRKRLPELLTGTELEAFYETVWHGHQLTHVAMLKLLIFTGIRNAELVHLRRSDVDLETCQLRITQGKGHKDRYVLFPSSFRGELAQYMERQQSQSAVYLFESNRHLPYSTRRVRQIVKQYATAAGIEKRVYPHLFRHQLITHLTKQGLISPKLQLLSGHASEQSLAIYRDLALTDVAAEYEEAMQSFPVR
jgi:site-specific recombinase XerD